MATNYIPRPDINTSYNSRTDVNFLMTQDLDFLMTQDDNYLILQDSDLVYTDYNTRSVVTTTYNIRPTI